MGISGDSRGFGAHFKTCRHKKGKINEKLSPPLSSDFGLLPSFSLFAKLPNKLASYNVQSVSSAVVNSQTPRLLIRERDRSSLLLPEEAPRHPSRLTPTPKRDRSHAPVGHKHHPPFRGSLILIRLLGYCTRFHELDARFQSDSPLRGIYIIYLYPGDEFNLFQT